MKPLSIIAILLSLLQACSTMPQTTYVRDASGTYCNDIEEINKIIFADVEMMEYLAYSIGDTLIFCDDKVVSIGFNRFFTSDIAKLKSQNDTTISKQQAYKQLQQEMQIFRLKKKVIVLNCDKASMERSKCHLEVSYSFYPSDSLYSVNIAEILKEPGHRQGCIYLIQKTANKYKILDSASWTE